MHGKVLPYYTHFASRDPEAGLGALTCDLDDVFQMPQPLKIARIVPAEIVALPLLDHVDHGVDPQRVFERREPCFLRALDVLEHVPAFERVAVRANRAFQLHQHRTHRAVSGGDAVCVSRHLGRLSELASHSFGLLQRGKCHRVTMWWSELKLNLMFGFSNRCALSTITALAHSGK